MPIRVPTAALDHLTNAPLKVAVAEVRFPPVHAVAKRELIADFQARLAPTYVAQEGLAAAPAVRVQFGPAAEVTATPQAQGVVWPFRDQRRGYSIELGASALSVEADSYYHDFPEFLGEFEAAVRAFADIFSASSQIRLGLRYVNELEDARLASKPEAIVSSALLAPIGTAIDGPPARSFAEVRVDEALGTFVLRHGLDRDAAKYLLDFDYFTEEPRPYDADSIVRTVCEFHELVERFFVWSLNPTYLGTLDG